MKEVLIGMLNHSADNKAMRIGMKVMTQAVQEIRNAGPTPEEQTKKQTLQALVPVRGIKKTMLDLFNPTWNNYPVKKEGTVGQTLQVLV
jgi:hypothetical protein